MNNEENGEIMTISIEAVLHSLIFAENIFNSGEGGIIIERIIGCALYNNINVRTKAMMCLAEVVRLYYNNIDSYMENIKNATFDIMTKDQEEVRTLAIEVW